MTITMPLSVHGRYITDANGNRLKLAGVNWPAHLDSMVPGGLDMAPRGFIADTLASWGFNSVRLTFSLRGIGWGGQADPAKLAANPDMQGMTPWGVYQVIAQTLTSRGIMVIPNCHMLFSGNCCTQADCNGLWYNDNWPSSTFTNTWLKLATRFADDPLVIGYDLKNEPRPATVGGVKLTPTWGDGNGQTDFRQMYSNTASRIHAADPDALIFAEGLNYATDLTKAGTHPVDGGGKVVYSLHEYSWFHPAGQSQADYFAAMDARGGYLLRDGIAPVWIGETGTENASRAAAAIPGAQRGSSSPSSADQGHWFGNFRAWHDLRDPDWCWWHMDATNQQGTEPVTNRLVYADGDRATYGLFAQDWQGPSSRDLLEVLQDMMRPRLGPGVP